MNILNETREAMSVRNNEARSCYHCCSGKATNITVLHVPITWLYFFNYSLCVCVLVLYVLFSGLCVLFCIVLCIVCPMYIVVYFLFVYNLTNHCHRMET